MATKEDTMLFIGVAAATTIAVIIANYFIIRSLPLCNNSVSSTPTVQTSAKMVSYTDPGYVQHVRSDPKHPVSYIEAHPSSL
jgi:hypothetical protein